MQQVLDQALVLGLAMGMAMEKESVLVQALESAYYLSSSISLVFEVHHVPI